MITKSDISAGHRRGFLSTCNVCGKEAPFNDMRCHVEANHIAGVSHSCNICGQISRTRQALRMHKLRNHSNDMTSNNMFCSWIYKFCNRCLCNFLTVSIFASLTFFGIYECHPVPTFLPLRSIWNAWEVNNLCLGQTPPVPGVVRPMACQGNRPIRSLRFRAKLLSYVPSSLCVLSLLRKIPKTPKSIILRQYAIDYLFSAGAGLGFLLPWKRSITRVFSKAQVNTSLVSLFSGVIIVESFHHFKLRVPILG